MKSVITTLEKHLDEIPKRIKTIPDDELIRRPAPGKWSKKEIMGHLVDSAIYNIIRFTQAQYKQVPFVIEGYEQDKLVELNDYQKIPIDHILGTWINLNRQIIFIMSKLSKEQLSIPILRRGEAKTLEWLVLDYVNHMEHHLGQIV